ncbi:usg protein [Falsiroseomonas oryziterrae]|uniref:usg protein n=1 Tax=Falsiroseomonas oryziterrae TaxID=2911368 RepID=UPI001F2AB3FD|nr:usg protein [Roseomonas sp. NPKOSM-4]
MDLSSLERLARYPLLPDWRLTTAELLYHMPDHPGVLQSFVWQKHDLAPRFPELGRFLDFWRREIEAPLHSVRVASAALMRPAELRYAGGEFRLH